MNGRAKAVMSLLALVVALAPACTKEPSREWAGPHVELIDCNAWAKVPRGKTIFFNNLWNVQAAGAFDWSQCVVRDPADVERLGFYWKWPNSGRDIYAQPQVKIGMSPWDPKPRLDTRFPIGIGSIANMRVTTQVEVDGPTQHNVVTTLWLTDNPAVVDDAKPDSIVAEVMIWTYATSDHVSPAGRRIGTVKQDEVDWDIWLDESWHDVSGVNANRWVYVAFVAKDQGFSADFDPVALLRSKPLAQLEFDNTYIADVELGAEIMRGEGVMWVDKFDVSIQRKSENPTSAIGAGGQRPF